MVILPQTYLEASRFNFMILVLDLFHFQLVKLFLLICQLLFLMSLPKLILKVNCPNFL
jgi:hypothetical protein